MYMYMYICIYIYTHLAGIRIGYAVCPQFYGSFGSKGCASMGAEGSAGSHPMTLKIRRANRQTVRLLKYPQGS